MLGWGSTYGAIQAAVRAVRDEGGAVAHAQLRHLNPFPANLGEIVRAYEAVLVPEVNLGQLSRLVRAEFLVDAHGLNKVNGLPFRRVDVQTAIHAQLDALHHHRGGAKVAEGGPGAGTNGYAKEGK